MKQLTLIDKAFLLKKTEIFRSLDLDYLLTLAEKLQPITVEQKQKIITKGTEATRLFIIVSGTVAIMQPDGELEAKELSENGYFGDRALFAQQAHDYTAVALTNCALFSLHASHIFALIEQSPTLAINLLQLYSKKNSPQ